MLIYYVCEDAPLKAIAIELIKNEKIGCSLQDIGTKHGGRSTILSRLKAYNQTSKKSPVVVFIDLDKYECAPSLFEKFPIKDRQPLERLQIRVAVREVESWLLADKQGMETYFGIPQNAIPHNPEELNDPKQKLFDLIKEKATTKRKRQMLREGNTKVGLEYNYYLVDFINTAWDSTRACANADSLVRAIKGIQKITP